MTTKKRKLTPRHELAALLRAGLCLLATSVIGATSAHAQGVAVIRVDADAPASSSQDGASWQTAALDLQAGLQLANQLFQLQPPPDRVEVWLAEGTYYPTVIPLSSDRDATFTIFDQLQVYGAFVGFDPTGQGLGNETDVLSRQGEAANTILSGNISGGLSNQTGNSYHVVTFNTNEIAVGDPYRRRAVLDSVTVEYGYADGASVTGDPLDDTGGGIIAHNNRYFAISSVVVRDCYARNEGGGIHLSRADEVQIRSCRIEDNLAGHIDPSGNPIGRGGGLAIKEACDFGDITLCNTIVARNQAPVAGGIAADQMRVGRLSFVNSLIIRNRGIAGVGGLWIRVEEIGTPCPDEAFIEIAHCTIAQNSGGGVFLEEPLTYFDNRPDLTIRSSILSGNSGGTIAAVDTDLFGPSASLAVVRYSNVRIQTTPVGQAGMPWPGPGNINAPPSFVNVAGNNFHLASSSPCIDAGEDTSLLALGPGNPPGPNGCGGTNYGFRELGDIADLDGDDITMEPLAIDLDGVAREANGPPADTGLDLSIAGAVSDMGCFEAMFVVDPLP